MDILERNYVNDRVKATRLVVKGAACWQAKEDLAEHGVCRHAES